MNCSCDALPTQICSLAVGPAFGAKASLPLINGIVRYLEYFLREQEGTPPAIAALRLCKQTWGPLCFWLGLDHDDEVLADSNHRGYEMFEIQDVTVLGTHND